MRTVLSFGLAACLATGLATGCAADDDRSSDGPIVVVTTTILGDVVRALAGDDFTVEVLLPIGVDPHDFALSARDAADLEGADLVVTVGAEFEAGLLDVVEAAVPDDRIFAYADAVPRQGDDPHFWMDPNLVADGLEELAAALGAVDGIDPAAVVDRAGAYREELASLDAEVEELVGTLPEERRRIVTNHEVLGYFAARYGFEVVGAVVPSLSTGAEPSSADVERLADLIRQHQVPAIFVETSSPTRLAEALAGAAGGVAVVELFTESLGEPGSEASTYLDLVRTDARRIVEALG